MDRAAGSTDKTSACMEFIFMGRQSIDKYIDNMIPGSDSAIRKVDKVMGLESGRKGGTVFNGVRPL